MREDRVRCGRGRDAVTLTPPLDAPLLRPECERITAGVLRAVGRSFAIALRMTVRAARCGATGAFALRLGRRR